MVVKPSYGLSEEAITSMLKSSFGSAEMDKKARMLAEARVNAGAILSAVELALKHDGELITAEDQQAIQAEMDKLQTLSLGDDAVAINQGVDQLNHAPRHLPRRA